MPKIVDEAAQRQCIRDAARTVFSRRGLAGTGLAHVAAEAGMRRSNLYHYYLDKNALIREMANELLEEEVTAFAVVQNAEGNEIERIQQVMRVALSKFTEDVTSCFLYLQLWATEPDSVQPYLLRIRTSLAKVVSEGQRNGHIHKDMTPDVAAVMLLGLIDGLLVQACLDPDVLAGMDELTRSMDSAIMRLLGSP